MRHEFVSDTGQFIGVLVHHDGRREILIYDKDDPDACSSIVTLTHDDTRTLTELLGASQVSEEIADASHLVAGQSIAWIKVAEEGPIRGTTISDGSYRTRTGASVVAVIREGEPMPTPTPDFAFSGGDLVVAIGSARALDELRGLLEADS